MELNETKLTNAVSAVSLRPSTEEEIRAVGAEPGYASPVGIEEVLVVVDEVVTSSPNLVAGANEEGYHFKNVNYGRDYEADIVTDLAAAEDGAACSQCGSAMRAVRGVEVGNIFKLGAHYSEKMGATFLDENGRPQPIIMGCYGIGVTRLLACIAEAYNDEYGLIWPMAVAPYQLHLLSLKGGEAVAEDLYQQLLAVGVEVFFDDRNESPGVKFKDADLIGIPIRLTVGARSLKNGGVELKLRHESDRSIVAVDDVVAKAQELIGQLMNHQ